jgi:hypothetical protein
MKRARHVLVAMIVVASFNGRAHAASEEKDRTGRKLTVWDEFNVSELKVTELGQPGYESWRERFDRKSRDIQVDVHSFDGKKTTHGKILYVAESVVATQGPVSEPEDEFNVFNEAVLQQQLVARILDRVLPDGPASLAASRTIDWREKKTGIEYTSSSTRGFVPAPWHVTGEVKLVGPDDIRYQLTLRATVEDAETGSRNKYVANFTGRLTKAVGTKIDDAFPLAGWKLSGFGIKESDSGNSVGYIPGPPSAPYTVVGDIRSRIAKRNADNVDPGRPDSSKNLTGFWKGDCKDAFGLQIIPHGNDGKYAVNFCGPGGCGRYIDNEVDTFITGAPNFQVISESEIRTRDEYNGWTVFYRCTRDTHPVLKY